MNNWKGSKINFQHLFLDAALWIETTCMAMTTTVVIFLTLGTRDQGLPGRELRSFDNLKLKLLLGLGCAYIWEKNPAEEQLLDHGVLVSQFLPFYCLYVIIWGVLADLRIDPHILL